MAAACRGSMAAAAKSKNHSNSPPICLSYIALTTSAVISSRDEEDAHLRKILSFKQKYLN